MSVVEMIIDVIENSVDELHGDLISIPSITISLVDKTLNGYVIWKRKNPVFENKPYVVHSFVIMKDNDFSLFGGIWDLTKSRAEEWATLDTKRYAKEGG